MSRNKNRRDNWPVCKMSVRYCIEGNAGICRNPCKLRQEQIPFGSEKVSLRHVRQESGQRRQSLHRKGASRKAAGEDQWFQYALMDPAENLSHRIHPYCRRHNRQPTAHAGREASQAMDELTQAAGPHHEGGRASRRLHERDTAARSLLLTMDHVRLRHRSARAREAERRPPISCPPPKGPAPDGPETTHRHEYEPVGCHGTARPDRSIAI